MSADTTNRRAFLKTGALFAAPVAIPAAAMATMPDPRLAAHADKAAIRDLHRAWLRDGTSLAGLVGTGEAIRRITTEDGAIELAADGRRASARFACTIDLATDLSEGGTFAQMARLQGNGTDHRTERRVLLADYVKRYGVWEVARVALV